MRSSTHRVSLAVIAVAMTALVGCGGGGDDGAATGGQGIQDRIGAAFAAVFNRSAFAEPVEPRPGDVPSVDLTADPIDF